MADFILIVGLAWWFGGTFLGTQSRIRNAGSSGFLGSRSPLVLHGVGAGAFVAMVWLGVVASARIAAADGAFGPFVFAAILAAVTAGCTLGAARA